MKRTRKSPKPDKSSRPVQANLSDPSLLRQKARDLMEELIRLMKEENLPIPKQC